MNSNQIKTRTFHHHFIISHIQPTISDENTNQSVVSPSNSLSSSLNHLHHDNQHQINHHHANDHRPSVSSIASINETISTHHTFTTQSHDPFINLGSIMSPAAYTNAPTTSCGLELSYGASNACQPQYHNLYALPSPSLSSTTLPNVPKPLTSESADGNCNNIMRIIDQTFRDNPDIFTDNYLKRFQTENNSNNNREFSCTNYCAPGTSSISGETLVSRDVTMTLKFDDNNDDKKGPSACVKQEKCDCVTTTFGATKSKEANSWQLIESNDCKMIQQRIEYFESFRPDVDPEVNSKAMFLYKENKIISGDGSVNRKNELKVGKSLKQQAICSDSHDSGYANASSNSLNREKSACSDCCYCNPLLHNDPNNKAESCIYCRNKTPNVDQETIPDTPCSLHGYYETMKTSNHVHTRIKSRESDTVSVKCTKTNERIKRTCCPNDCSTTFTTEKPERKVDPKGSKAGGHLSRPKDINNILRTTNVQKVEKEIHDRISRSPKMSKHHPSISKQSLIKDTKPKEIRLPSPYKCISSNSYESTSDSSCSLTCSPTKKTTLPQATWQQHHHNIPPKPKNHPIKAKTMTNTLPRTNSHTHYHATPTAPSTPEHKLTKNNKNIHDAHAYQETLDTNANHQRHYDHYNNHHHQQTNLSHNTNNNNNENENNVNNIDSDTQYKNFVNNNDCTSPNIITTCQTTTNNVNTNGNNMTTTAGNFDVHFYFFFRFDCQCCLCF